MLVSDTSPTPRTSPTNLPVCGKIASSHYTDSKIGFSSLLQSSSPSSFAGIACPHKCLHTRSYTGRVIWLPSPQRTWLTSRQHPKGQG